MKLNKLKSKGWEIINCDNLKKFYEAENLIVKNINKIFKKNNKKIEIKNIFALNEYESYLNYNIINQIRQLYISNFSFLLSNIFSKKLNYFFGKNIFIQKYPTLRVHMGKKSVTSLSPHIELMAGHSPYVFNFWIPFQQIDNNKGIWIIDIKDSLRILKVYKNTKSNDLMTKIKKSKSFKYIHLKRGQSILFNSFIFHGSEQFLEDGLRISADIRIQKYNSPLLYKGSEYYSYQKLK